MISFVFSADPSKSLTIMMEHKSAAFQNIMVPAFQKAHSISISDTLNKVGPTALPGDHCAINATTMTTSGTPNATALKDISKVINFKIKIVPLLTVSSLGEYVPKMWRAMKWREEPCLVPNEHPDWKPGKPTKRVIPKKAPSGLRFIKETPEN